LYRYILVILRLNLVLLSDLVLIFQTSQLLNLTQVCIKSFTAAEWIFLSLFALFFTEISFEIQSPQKQFLLVLVDD
jgi:hypothetical protein